MAVRSDRLSPQPVRAILALPFPFPIGPFLGSFPGAFLPSLSPVLAPFFITPSLPSHIGSSGRHHARIFIGNRGRWSRLDITPIDRAQYAETQKNQQYPCAHDVFLTAFRVLCQSFFPDISLHAKVVPEMGSKKVGSVNWPTRRRAHTESQRDRL